MMVFFKNKNGNIYKITWNLRILIFHKDILSNVFEKIWDS